jgi:hypothetical protein
MKLQASNYPFIACKALIYANLTTILQLHNLCGVILYEGRIRRGGGGGEDTAVSSFCKDRRYNTPRQGSEFPEFLFEIDDANFMIFQVGTFMRHNAMTGWLLRFLTFIFGP